MDIKHIKLLTLAADADRNALIEKSSLVTVNEGEEIFILGEQSKPVIHLLLNGHIKMVCRYDSGKFLLLEEINPGDVFGYEDTVAGQPFTANAEATCTCEILSVPVEVFLTFLRTNNEAFAYFAKQRALNTHQLNIRVSNSACLTNKELVARDILKRYAHQGFRGVADVPPLEQWASYLGIRRESLSRALSELLQECSFRRLNKTSLAIDDTIELSEYSPLDNSYYQKN